jgi:hypothetical protein
LFTLTVLIMQRTLKKIITEHPILRAVVVFCVSYAILSVLWFQVRGIYGYGVSLIASKVVAEMKDARIEEITGGRNVITLTFGSIQRGQSILVDVPVKLFAFAFNVPIIIAMLFSLYPFLKRRRRAYAEALIILVLIHILYVFALGMFQLTETFMIRGIEAKSVSRLSIYEFLWAVTSYASVSFVPFLIVIYTLIRFRKEPAPRMRHSS